MADKVSQTRSYTEPTLCRSRVQETPFSGERADVRLILHRHLCLELALSRSQHARDTGASAVYDTFGDIFSYIFSGSDIYFAGWRVL